MLFCIDRGAFRLRFLMELVSSHFPNKLTAMPRPSIDALTALARRHLFGRRKVSVRASGFESVVMPTSFPLPFRRGMSGGAIIVVLHDQESCFMLTHTDIPTDCCLHLRRSLMFRVSCVSKANYHKSPGLFFK
jgi:hypothetical protein